jgi:hypothetical protein
MSTEFFTNPSSLVYHTVRYHQLMAMFVSLDRQSCYAYLGLNVIVIV